ncbi:MAG TPA: recombinase family protein [Planctomycetaceae bacterium]|jgi:DNA invertase Pin-like site-specific DNA recombinase|nr:recombinase family protein [Planctomycetaceae bacterium]
MKLIAYYRVSTKRQGESGLGLEGQRASVEAYATRIGAAIVAEFTEVESGKRSDRPELAAAIGYARRSKATLVVAKLDRLSRNLAFLATLLESQVDFVAVDNPSANRLTVHILAAVAEAEAKAISERTKAALEAARKRGTKLGSARPNHWKGREDRRLAGSKLGADRAAEVHRSNAKADYADLLPTIAKFRRTGDSLQAIANKLNELGHATRGRGRNHEGGKWYPSSVLNVLKYASQP